jgi:hypothetical protein
MLASRFLIRFQASSAEEVFGGEYGLLSFTDFNWPEIADDASRIADCDLDVGLHVD